MPNTHVHVISVHTIIHSNRQTTHAFNICFISTRFSASSYRQLLHVEKREYSGSVRPDLCMQSSVTQQLCDQLRLKHMIVVLRGACKADDMIHLTDRFESQLEGEASNISWKRKIMCFVTSIMCSRKSLKHYAVGA